MDINDLERPWNDLPFFPVKPQMFYTLTGIHLCSVSLIGLDWGGHTHTPAYKKTHSCWCTLEL